MISICSKIRIIITFIFLNIVGICLLNDRSHLAYSKDITCEDKIHAVMGKYYRGYRLITLDFLEGDLIEYFKQNFANENPGCVSADFNGDGTIDYAVLLVREEQKMTIEKVVVFKGQQNGEFIPINLYTIRDRFHDFYLQKITPGKIKEVDSEYSVIIKNPAFALNLFESASRVYFWDGKIFRNIQTSD